MSTLFIILPLIYYLKNHNYFRGGRLKIPRGQEGGNKLRRPDQGDRSEGVTGVQCAGKTRLLVLTYVTASCSEHPETKEFTLDRMPDLSNIWLAIKILYPAR